MQDMLSDAAHADKAQRLAGHFNAGGVVLRSKADRAVLVGNGNDVLRQREHQREGVLGDGKTVRVRGDGHGDAVALAVVEVDIIVAHAVLGDDLEVLRRREQRTGQLDNAHEHGVRVHDLAADDIHVAVGVDDGVARRGQQLGSDGVDRFGDENFCHDASSFTGSGRRACRAPAALRRPAAAPQYRLQHFLPPCGRSVRRAGKFPPHHRPFSAP